MKKIVMRWKDKIFSGKAAKIEEDKSGINMIKPISFKLVDTPIISLLNTYINKRKLQYF
jgi:hypothetical protein